LAGDNQLTPEELEVLRKDAERYRWIRSKQRDVDTLILLVSIYDTDEMDEAIDYAIYGE
jgi:hypothetical protein